MGPHLACGTSPIAFWNASEMKRICRLYHRRTVIHETLGRPILGVGRLAWLDPHKVASGLESACLLGLPREKLFSDNRP